MHVVCIIVFALRPLLFIFLPHFPTQIPASCRTDNKIAHVFIVSRWKQVQQIRSLGIGDWGVVSVDFCAVDDALPFGFVSGVEFSFSCGWPCTTDHKFGFYEVFLFGDFKLAIFVEYFGLAFLILAVEEPEERCLFGGDVHSL